MRIIPLPEKTVRLLGSAAAVSSPVDVIKELLDNALDAEANSVEILVSPNLIDRIQVRDNGHGIQEEDFKSLGCVGHTSKLHSFEELQALGVKTLGFRGQALASTNSLGRITVVTRCIGDSTAMKLTICAGVGGIESQQRVSAPVGTTVTVTGLFKFIPVREQVAEKDAQKNLAKVKHLFQAYALARPLVRLSLKVVGGDIKQNWSYSPRPGAGVREAVVQVFGAGVVAECVFRTESYKADSPTGKDAHEKTQIIIEAVLPKPDADLSKLSKGSFVSVDSRPVSTSHGTMKKSMSILKAHFKTSLAVDAEDRRLTDLFTCVNVKCSPGSYDPNVEPSKSQVLFVDESQLVGLFEGLCSNTYQNLRAVDAFATIERRPLARDTQTQTPPPSSDGPHHCHKPFTSHLDELPYVEHIRQPRTPEALSPNISLRGPLDVCAVPSQQACRLRAPETQTKASLQTLLLHESGNSVPDPTNPSNRPGRKRKFVVNMSTDPNLSSDEEAETNGLGSYDLQETFPSHEGPSDSHKEALNPWTIARLTAPARQITADDVTEASAGRHVVRTEEHYGFSAPVEPFEEELPILQPQMNAPRDLDTPRVKRFSTSHIGHVQAPNITYAGPPNSRYPQTSSRGTIHEPPQSLPPADRSTERRQLPDYRPHSDTAADKIDRDGLFQTTLSFDESRESQHDDPAQAQLRIDDIPTRMRQNPPFRKPRRVNKRDQGHSEREDHSIEQRNAEKIANVAMTDHRLASSTLPDLRPVALGDGHGAHLMTEQQAAGISTFDGDSRQYLIRRQRSEAAHRREGRQSIKRTKTDKLPLETIPSGNGTGQLVLYLSHETAQTCIASKRTASLTAYREGVRFGDTMSLEDVNDIQSKLQTVVASWTEKTFGEKAEIEIDLRKAVKRTVAA
ncbi:hypothetical protein KVR01_005628 [Diaporthe batatas]|uniref:uncharacterized protein n=1 Tax=Diaporthe batatas TaxID=748121 RepID=UPI001D050851|nr:uncharacterized protein KVR01_005628 [Diaporthe batatas]KAG8165353.1 hypothetical protein KVR01_005628 [Diaporthe batatas]